MKVSNRNLCFDAKNADLVASASLIFMPFVPVPVIPRILHLHSSATNRLEAGDFESAGDFVPVGLSSVCGEAGPSPGNLDDSRIPNSVGNKEE